MKYLIFTFSIAAVSLVVSLTYASLQVDSDLELKKKKSGNWSGTMFLNQVATSVGSPGSFLNTIWLWISGREERRPRKDIVFPPVIAGDIGTRSGEGA